MKPVKDILLDKDGVASIFGLDVPKSRVTVTDERTGIQFIITPLYSGGLAEVKCSTAVDWDKVEDVYQPLRSKFVPMKRRWIRRYK